MNVSTESFLIVNGAIVTALVVYFMLIKWNRPRPMPLKMNQKSSGRGSASKTGPAPSFEAIESDSKKVPRVLNVMFLHNGHSFDAYEALGLPAGSNEADAEIAFKEQIQGCDPSSRLFYESAYKAISKHMAS